MPIYTELLEAALELRDGQDADTDKLVAELVGARAQLQRQVAARRVPGRVPAAVADELAYDIALVTLCRHEGIDCSLHSFDQPGRGHGQLEAELVDRGLVPSTLGPP